ncbi:MAG: PAS domain-containing protein [Bacteroidales bacterium]|jgi:hypothetical protein|nr:PAS domain-containing protein [Bacteroidales bacterium]
MKNNNLPDFILSNLSLGVYLLDENNHLLYFNEAFRSLFGAGDNSIGLYVGHVLSCGFDSDNKEGQGTHCRYCGFSKAYQEVRKTGNPSLLQKQVLKQTNTKGGIYYLEISVFPMPENRLLVFVNDQTHEMEGLVKRSILQNNDLIL